MERNFFKLNDSYEAVAIISVSPEEAQHHDKIHPDSSEWPLGYYIDCVRRMENGRVVHYLGMAKVGERLKLPGADEKPLKPASPKSTPLLPSVVEKASEENLEVMAARNGIDTASAAWKKRPIVAKRADVADAMRKLNAA